MSNDDLLVKELIDSISKFKKLFRNSNNNRVFKHGEFMILNILKKDLKESSKGVKVSTLSKLLEVTPPHVTQIISSLEERGYTKRSMDENDRRAVRVKLTESGLSELEKCSKEFDNQFKVVVEILGIEDSKNLISIINKLYDYYLTVKQSN